MIYCFRLKIKCFSYENKRTYAKEKMEEEI